VNTVAFGPDSKTVITACEDGTSRIWPIDPLPVAAERRPRELSAEERSRWGIR
jgi:hypothetical protein